MSVAPPNLDLLTRHLGLHATLSPEDRGAILALPHTVRVLEPAAYMVREGDAPTQCGVLISGFAFRQKLTGDGTRQIVSIHIPGEAIDFQNLYLDVSDHSVQMLTRGEVAFVARSHFQELAVARPAVGHAILVALLVEASIFREWVLNVGRRNSRARLSHLLCEFAIRLDAMGLSGQYGYELPMTQEQLADALGLTPVHVNRTLRVLETEGLIVRSKRNVRFPDWQKMRTVGDFTQRYLHLEPQRSGRPDPRPHS